MNNVNNIKAKLFAKLIKRCELPGQYQSDQVLRKTGATELIQNETRNSLIHELDN